MEDSRGSYLRPLFSGHTYSDSTGAEIPFGSRWCAQDAPPDSYSRASHPERYAPLQAVARALVSHLDGNYLVDRTEDLTGNGAKRPRSENVLERTTLTPYDSSCSAITFVYSEFPRVIVQAGQGFDARYPVCGCDACDEPLDFLMQSMEDTVFAIVSGGFHERVEGLFNPRFRWVVGGEDMGSGLADQHSRHEIRLSRRILRSLNGAWKPWPTRIPQEQ